MRLLLCILTLTFCFSAALAQPREKARQTYDYLLYLPKDYNANKKEYPLMIYLHGGGQRGQDSAKLNAYGPHKLIKEGRHFDFIIVSPQCPEGKYWSTDNWFEPLYAELLSKYRVDKKRVYLTGISMGGYGTWQTAVAYPNTFAAILPLCGGCDDSTRICTIRQVPVWTFHGTADNLIPIGVTERLVKQLEGCEGNVTFTKLEGAGHDIETVYERQDVYDWLLSQDRKKVGRKAARTATNP